MKLVVQRVARASVEVDGYVESRIGSGLVLSLALRLGDTREQALRLASRVVKLKLWPEMLDPEKLWSSSVVDNGFEVLVLCQQSLCASFQQAAPSQSSALGAKEAKALFEAFVTQLQKEYQEEMIVAAPFETANVSVEATQDGPGMFELDTSESTTARPTASQESLPTAKLVPELAVVKAALESLADFPHRTGGQAAVQASRIFPVLGMKTFRDELANAAPADYEEFGEALVAVAGIFSRKQQESITAWTGLSITTPPAEPAQEGKNEEPPRKRRVGDIKEEQEEAAVQTPVQRRRPDLAGKAAPNTPASGRAQVGRYGAQPQAWDHASYRAGIGHAGSKNQGKKGKGRGVRAYGIASLDESARLHGSNGTYDRGQLSALPDAKMKVGPHGVKEELDEEGKRKLRGAGGVLKRLKGTPTVAPQCPGQAEDDEEVWEDL